MANPRCRERGFCIFYFLLPTIEETNPSHQFSSKFCWKVHLPLKPPFTAMRLWKTCWILWISCGMALGNCGFLFGKPPNVQKLKGNLSWRSNEFLLYMFGVSVIVSCCVNWSCFTSLFFISISYLFVLQHDNLSSRNTLLLLEIWYDFWKWCVLLCVLYQKQVSFFHVPVPSYANLTNSLPILEPSHPPKMSLSLSGLDVDARSNDSAEVPWAARNDLQELQISEKWWVKSPQISH